VLTLIEHYGSMPTPTPPVEEHLHRPLHFDAQAPHIRLDVADSAQAESLTWKGFEGYGQ